MLRMKKHKRINETTEKSGVNPILTQGQNHLHRLICYHYLFVHMQQFQLLDYPFVFVCVDSVIVF